MLGLRPLLNKGKHHSLPADTIYTTIMVPVVYMEPLAPHPPSNRDLEHKPVFFGGLRPAKNSLNLHIGLTAAEA